MKRYRTVIIVVAAIVLLAQLYLWVGVNKSIGMEAWLRDRRSGGSETRDTIETLIIALGPGAISLVITLLASRVVRSKAAHRVWGVVALGFILIQVGWVCVACLVFGGRIALNSFTVTALVGLMVYVVGLVIYFVRGSKRVAECEEKDRA